GPRFDLFSMLAVAAARGMGVALVPAMLAEAELARGELVVPCERPLEEGRAYHLVIPERKAGNPALERFRDWLLAEASEAPEGVPSERAPARRQAIITSAHRPGPGRADRIGRDR
ncbi:MAG TPA: LysR substrate-binding domain-containing protein, partial [Quisquiliibacterium sp.]|nr:LysR substrate-binding domain-containing protein [Quisquiliibacterium sp.]